MVLSAVQSSLCGLPSDPPSSVLLQNGLCPSLSVSSEWKVDDYLMKVTETFEKEVR